MHTNFILNLTLFVAKVELNLHYSIKDAENEICTVSISQLQYINVKYKMFGTRKFFEHLLYSGYVNILSLHVGSGSPSAYHPCHIPLPATADG